MFQIAGGSVGLGLTTTVFTTVSEDKLQSAATGLSESQIEDVQGVLAGTESAGSPGEQVIDLVREAFASGLAWSFRLVAVLALAGLVVSVLFVGGRVRTAAAATSEPG
jgi:hypothetical protein